VPALSSQLNHEAAIHRRTTHRSTDSLKHYTTVHCVEVDTSIDVSYGDTAIRSFYGNIRTSRDKHFVTDVPLIIPLTLRTARKNLRATSFDSNLPAKRF